MAICSFYAGIYIGPARSIGSTQLESMLDSALPELYAAVIVFAVKARAYFETKGTYPIFRVQIIILTYI